MKNKLPIYIIAMAAHGSGLSGGDRIFIEFSRRWSKKNPLTIYCWEEGYEMCQRQTLDNKNISYHIVKMGIWKHFGFLINYLARIMAGIILAFSIKIESSQAIIYSASEFWMDSLPAFILKMRFKKTTWVATWFQTAPNPFKGFTEGRRAGSYKVQAFLYWFSQFPVKPLVTNYADFVLVNNEAERKQFPSLNNRGKVVVVIGAVDVTRIDEFKNKNRGLKKIYDGVFQGRFHAQKGVVELIDIWGKVVDKIPGALLIMIGDGPLMSAVKSRIHKLGLEKNIELTGYLFDGIKKYTIFSQSKVVLHPAYYDSGGMAAAEAMAFGVPCVGFNLESYQSYYSYGMIKVKIGDLEAFAETVVTLLKDEKLKNKVSNQALEMIKTNWSWDKRAKDVFDAVTKNI